jgi:membrane associated rhomboid family serine protease
VAALAGGAVLGLIFILSTRIGWELMGRRTTGAEVDRRRVRVPAVAPPVASILFLLAVTVCSLVQLGYPGLRDALQVDRHRIAGGQVWRLLTGVLVQNGGVAGTVFNLVTLAVLGVIAELAFGRARWLVLAGAGTVVLSTMAAVTLPTEAGNSGVVFTLAGGVAVLAIREARRGGDRRAGDAETAREARRAGFIVLGLGAVLLALGNGHGYAVLLGAVVGALLPARRDASGQTAPGGTGPRRAGPRGAWSGGAASGGNGPAG